MRYSAAKIQRAIELRDAALSILRAHGKWFDNPPYRTLGFEGGGLTIDYRTPLAGGSEHANFRPHGLDVWFDGKEYAAAIVALESESTGFTNVVRLPVRSGGRPIMARTPFDRLPDDVWFKGKVLRIEWDEQEGVDLTNYQPGFWEGLLERESDRKEGVVAK
jgi:hypothetical protein